MGSNIEALDPVSREVKDQIASIRENGFETVSILIGEEIFLEWAEILQESDPDRLKTGIHHLMGVRTVDLGTHEGYPTVAIYEDIPVVVDQDIPDRMAYVGFTSREKEFKDYPGLTTKGSPLNVDWSWSGLTTSNHIGNVFKPDPFTGRSPKEMEKELIRKGEKAEKQKRGYRDNRSDNDGHQS